MKILFLTLCDIHSYQEHQIYCDLIREFISDGHDVYCISPVERKTGIHTHLTQNGKILKQRILNTQKTNVFEKGISIILLDYIFLKGIKCFFSNIKFDLIIYSTPPITLLKSIAYLKKRDQASTYLILRDIFPQNSVDLGILKKSGLKGILYRYFRKKEIKLYDISDKIGCLSPQNVRYIQECNPTIERTKLEICPNSMDCQNIEITYDEKIALRKKYEIPLDKTVFVYGGNLGKPQGIPFLIDAINSQTQNNNVFFLIVGSGTEFNKIEKEFQEKHIRNAKLMRSIEKNDYDRMIASCDVGLVFLDYRFTIPNYPSRILSYMQAKLPVFACTDIHTDIKQAIIEGKFGWWCPSNDIGLFNKTISEIQKANLVQLGKNAYNYLLKHFSSSIVYNEMSIPHSK